MSIITLLIGSILIGHFLLRWPVLLIIGLGIGLLWAMIIFASNLKMATVGGLVLANFAFWIIHGLLIGSLTLGEMMTSGFIQGDGRIFLYYIPLLIFTILRVNESEFKRTINIIQVVAILSFCLYVIWMILRPDILSGGRAANFFGLHTSHTGAGTYFGALAIMLVLFGVEAGQRKSVILGLFLVFVSFGTASREAMLGILAVGVWYVITKKKIIILKRTLLLVLVSLMLLPLVAPHTYRRTANLFSPRLIEEILRTLKNVEHVPGTIKDDRDIPGAYANVLLRIALWKYAVGRFIDSPLIGMGWGRWNDTGLQFYGKKGIIYVAMEGERNYNAAQAHNSYLHLLAESGILGLALMLALWNNLYQQCKSALKIFSDDKETYAYYIGSMGVIIFTLTSAMFGHALAAPSLGILTTLICGVGISHLTVQRRSNMPAVSETRAL